ncbi:MAG: BrnT family toxin [Gammaproteobacteria bacterium]
MSEESFEWGSKKGLLNQAKHGVAFEEAQYAFADPHRVIAEDLSHGTSEKRYYCFGKVRGGILTVRFTYRQGMIRILGAGYWRKGKQIYERENQVHRRAPGRSKGSP